VDPDRAVGGLAGGQPCLGRLDPVVDGVADQVEKRVGDLLKDPAVELGLLAAQLQLDRSAERAGQVADGPAQGLGDGAEGDHAGLEGPLLEALQGPGELVQLGHAGRFGLELVGGQPPDPEGGRRRLADEADELVEAFHGEADGLAPAPARRGIGPRRRGRGRRVGGGGGRGRRRGGRGRRVGGGVVAGAGASGRGPWSATTSAAASAVRSSPARTAGISSRIPSTAPSRASTTLGLAAVWPPRRPSRISSIAWATSWTSARPTTAAPPLRVWASRKINDSSSWSPPSRSSSSSSSLRVASRPSASSANMARKRAS